MFRPSILRLSRTTSLALLALLTSSLSQAAQSVALSWNPGTDVAGYRIYYGTSVDHLGEMIDVGAETEVTVQGLAERTTYYFAVTAYDGDGLESLPSDPVSRMTLDSYDAWKTRGSVAGDLDARDGDQVPPVMEYAFGTNPNGRDPMPAAEIRENGLSLTYTRDLYAAGVSVVVEVADSPGGPWFSGDSHVAESTLSDNGKIRTIRATDRTSVSEAASRFIRIRVD